MGLGNLINLYRVQKLYSLLRKAKDNPKLLNDIKWWKEVANTALAIKEIQEMLKFLQGYKSYIIAAIIAVLAGLHAMGYIDEATYQTLLALLSAGAVSTVAAKMNRIQQDVKDNEAKRVLTEQQSKK
jgi:hypothetical protein